MKKLMILSALLLASLSAARAQYTGSVRISDSEVRVDGDSVRVTMRLQIDRQSAAWFEGVALTPALTDGDPTLPETHIAALPEVMLRGANKSRATERALRLMGDREVDEMRLPEIVVDVEKATDTIIDYNRAVLRKPWMDGASLTIYEESIGFRNERQLLVMQPGNRVEVPAPVPVVVPPPAPAPKPIPPVTFVIPDRTLTLEGEALIDFPVNRTEILPDFHNNRYELVKMRDVLRSVQSDPDATIVSLSIEGCASPEGAYYNNDRLAFERTEAMKQYILHNFYLPIEASQIRTSHIAEDWDGLAEMVRASDLWQKERILDIIAFVPILDGREAQLIKLDGGRPYQRMLHEMFPLLRRVKYRIEYTTIE